MKAQRISNSGAARRSLAGRAASSPAGRCGASGFTLLEILVATAILGTSVAALFGLLSGSLGNVQRLRGPAEALMLAEGRMNELLAAGVAAGGGAMAPIPLDRKIEGRWDGDFRWEARATRFKAPPDIAPGQPVMVRISLDVFWKRSSGGPEKKISLETIQLQQEPPRPTQ